MNEVWSDDGGFDYDLDSELSDNLKYRASAQVMLQNLDEAKERERNPLYDGASAPTPIISFSGETNAVNAFRSLIPFGDENEDPIPSPVAPFVADVLVQIFLFLPMERRPGRYWVPMAVSHTCQMWRFYANFLPHWGKYYSPRMYELQCFRFPTDEPRYVTREMIGDIFRQRSEMKEKCPALRPVLPILFFMISVAFLMGNYCAGFFLGLREPDKLTNDMEIGSVAFVMALALICFETLLFFSHKSRTKASELRRGNHLAVLIVLSVIFVVVLALIGKRITALQRLIDAGETNLGFPSQCNPFISIAPRTRKVIPATVELPAMAGTAYIVPYFHSALSSPIKATLYVSLSESEVNKNVQENNYFNVSDPFACLLWNSSVPAPRLFAFLGSQVTFSRGAKLSKNFRTVLHSDWFDVSDGAQNLWYSDSNIPWALYGIHLLNPAAAESFGDITRRYAKFEASARGIVFASVAIQFAVFLCHIVFTNIGALEKFSTVLRAICVVIISPLSLLCCGIICIVGSTDSVFMCDQTAGIVMVAAGAVLTVALLFTLNR